MSRKQRSNVKVFLIGFVSIKLVVAVACLSGMLPLGDLLSSRGTATALAEGTEAVAAETSEEASVAAEKTAQYAEIQAIMDQLEIKRLQLAEEEDRIRNERDQLEQLKLDIDMKLEELKAVQAEIDKGLARKAQLAAQEQQQQSAAEAAKVKRLVKVYSSMSPKKAAEIIDKLDMKVIYQVFSNMKGEEVGKILANVNGEKAAKITERLAAKTD
jgi:flagellar motility protein MotE (MotC chaperone)